MIIIKRSGRTEEFSDDKLLQSIIAANEESNEFLNESDLKIILEDFRRIVNSKGRMHSNDIAVIVVGLLYLKGLHDTIKYYTEYGK